MTERTKGKAWLLGRAAANDKAHEQAELRLWWVACGLKGRVHDNNAHDIRTSLLASKGHQFTYRIN
jgi:hypothetical protein